MLVRVGDEVIEEDVRLRGPPAVDGLLGDLRASRDALDGHSGEAALDTTFASMADYLRYVRDPASGYVTVAFPVEDGMEISSWTGVSRDRSV